MYVLGAQFDKQSGPDGVNQHKIIFTVDESQQAGLYRWLSTVRKGSSVLLVIFDAEKEESEITSIATETPEKTKKRLFRRVHAMIDDIARDKSIEPEKVKIALKDFLKDKGYIKESTKELDLRGLAASVYYLQNEFDV